MAKQPRPSDRNRTGWATALIAAVIVVGASACGSSNPTAPSSTVDAPSTAPASSAAPATSAAAATSATAPASSAAPASTETASAAAKIRQVEQAGFATPSGNIVCALGAGGVRCDYWDFSQPAENRAPNWELPAKPENCVMDWGNSLTLEETAHLTCHGDAIYSVADVNQPANASNVAWFDPARDATIEVNGLKLAVLGYNETLQSGDVLCSSDATGVTCYNGSTGVGFFISRDSYRIW